MITTILFFVFVAFFSWWFFENRRRKRHPVQGGIAQHIEIPHEREFELYHNALSLCSMKTRVCLAELGIEYRSHPVDLIETGCYENIRPCFLRVNPAGTVPVLIHNGHPIYESDEQILYAASHAPMGASALIPTDSDELQAMKLWMGKASLKGDPIEVGPISAGMAVPGLTIPLFSSMLADIPLWKIVEGLLFHFDKRRPLVFTLLKLMGLDRLNNISPVMKIHRQSRINMFQYLDELEQQLRDSGGPWILGSQFSLADVSWLVILERLLQADSLQIYVGGDQRVKTAQYWERLKLRPSYRGAILNQQHHTVTRGTSRLIEAKERSTQLGFALDGEKP